MNLSGTLSAYLLSQKDPSAHSSAPAPTKLSNRAIGNLGEEAVASAPIFKNALVLNKIPTDETGGDIDHAIISGDTLHPVETKNLNADHVLYPDWVRDHVIARKIKAQPLVDILKAYFRCKKVQWIVTHPTGKGTPKALQMLKEAGFKILVTGCQIKNTLDTQARRLWHQAISRFFHSVSTLLYNTEGFVKTVLSLDSDFYGNNIELMGNALLRVLEWTSSLIPRGLGPPTSRVTIVRERGVCVKFLANLGSTRGLYKK